MFCIGPSSLLLASSSGYLQNILREKLYFKLTLNFRTENNLFSLSEFDRKHRVILEVRGRFLQEKYYIYFSVKQVSVSLGKRWTKNLSSSFRSVLTREGECEIDVKLHQWKFTESSQLTLLGDSLLSCEMWKVIMKKSTFLSQLSHLLLSSPPVKRVLFV